MASSKKIPTEKPKVVTVDHVPDVLGSNYYSYDKLKLLCHDGKIAVFYKNTGTILLANIHDKETKMLKATNNLLHVEVVYPFIFCVLDNDSIQIINIETGTCDKHQQEKDTVKKVQSLLVDTKKVFCITATVIYIWNRERLDLSPRVVPLKDARDPKTRTIINVKHNFSAVISVSRLLLGNADVFQVWEFDELKDEMYMLFEGRNSVSTDKYFGVYFTPEQTTIITTNKNTFMVWDFNKPKKAASNPKEVKETDLITSVFIDDSFLILGNCNGLLTLRQRSDGERLYDLNIAEASKREDTNALLDFNLAHKVNCITKVGRWVFSGFENNRFAVYDITQSNSSPVLEYVHPKAGVAIRSILAESDTIIMTLKQTKPTGKEKSKDKDKTPKMKPDIGIWVPLPAKIPGLEFYNQKIKAGKDKTEKMNSMTLPVSYSYFRIATFMQEIETAGEDVTEFTSILDRVGEIIALLSRNPDLNISFLNLKTVQTSLDEYESMLEKLTQTGRLIRFFTSNRLRRGIEVQNSALHSKLNDLEPLMKNALEEKKKHQQAFSSAAVPTMQKSPSASTTTPPATTQPGLSRPRSNQYASYPNIAPDQHEDKSKDNSIQGRTRRSTTDKFLIHESMIADVGGKDFWRKTFGEGLMIEWERFISGLSQFFPGKITSIEAKQLQAILDHSNTGYISQYKFSEFLKGFGPFEKSVENVKKLLSEKWFHGWLSSRESELLFRTGYEQDGTYLVRFSKSKPGSFALAFVKGNAVKHILIESNMPEGFRISEQETSGTTRVFKTLDEIIIHYKFVLQYPYTDTLSQAPWFHGDLSTEEANELLAEQPKGTFLIRFSRQGSFAASFVDANSVPRHVLINTPSRNKFVVVTGDGEQLSFSSVKELVNYYLSKQVFTAPLHTTNR